VRAREDFIRARDLDVVRFRAPSDLNDIVRRISAEEGAIYVPVAETFDSAATGHMPGSSLILEHVHPTIRGYALIGHAYFDALRAEGFAGRRSDLTALRDWSEYVVGQQLTPFDERVAEHTVATITSRWPFVSASEQRDYRGTYRPTGVLDSLALLVSRGGMTWQAAKLELAQAYAVAGAVDSSVAELEGLARDFPVSGAPLRLAARTLIAASQPEAAESLLIVAERRDPSAEGNYQLGLIAAGRRDFQRAIEFFERSLQIAPTQPDAWYRLSLAYGLTRNIEKARSTAMRANQLDPRVPGLAEWMRTIGLRP
jgi:tetratricopeptide (TPR) repeat protein